jgi:hypothetical protein
MLARFFWQDGEKGISERLATEVRQNCNSKEKYKERPICDELDKHPWLTGKKSHLADVQGRLILDGNAVIQIPIGLLHTGFCNSDSVSLFTLGWCLTAGTTTDKEGSFHFSSIPTGKYKLIMWAKDLGKKAKTLHAQPQVIEIAEGVEKIDIDVSINTVAAHL